MVADVAKKKGNESKNNSPPIPPTRIQFLLTPDLFYVRFLEFSVFHFLLQFFQFFGPYRTRVGPYWFLIYFTISTDSLIFGSWLTISGHIVVSFGDICSHKTSETLFLFVIFSILRLLFSQYCLKSKSPLPKSMRNVFPLHPVTSKRPESPYGAKYFFGVFGRKSSFSVFRPRDPL